MRGDLYRKGIQKLKEMPIAAGVPVKSEGASAAKAGPGLTGVQWVQIGPKPAALTDDFNFQGTGPISGEVVDMAIDPRGTSEDVIYITTNQGGVWRSTDGGDTFEPRTDYSPILSMGALALDNGNPSMVYAGTGNLFDGNGNRWQTSPGIGSSPNAVGIYKSTDMGQTWSTINPNGIFNSTGFHRMVSTVPGSDAGKLAPGDRSHPASSCCRARGYGSCRRLRALRATPRRCGTRLHAFPSRDPWGLRCAYRYSGAMLCSCLAKYREQASLEAYVTTPRSF